MSATINTGIIIQPRPPPSHLDRRALSPRSSRNTAEVCRLLRISKPTLWRLRQAERFPQPTEVTDRVIAWRRSKVEEWLTARRSGGGASNRLPPAELKKTPEPKPNPSAEASSSNRAPPQPVRKRRRRKKGGPTESDSQLLLI